MGINLPLGYLINPLVQLPLGYLLNLKKKLDSETQFATWLPN